MSTYCQENKDSDTISVRKDKIVFVGEDFNKQPLIDLGVWSDDEGVNWPMLFNRIHSAPTGERQSLLNFAEETSSTWVTCACGVQCAALPREDNGAPQDKVLRYLGKEFHWKLASARAAELDNDHSAALQDLIYAEQVLELIEIQAGTLLKLQALEGK